jgi:hypothetical protein
MREVYWRYISDRTSNRMVVTGNHLYPFFVCVCKFSYSSKTESTSKDRWYFRANSVEGQVSCSNERYLFINTVLNYHLWLEYRNLTFNGMLWKVFWKYFSFDFDFQSNHSTEKIVFFRSVQGRAPRILPFRSYNNFPESPQNRSNDL